MEELLIDEKKYVSSKRAAKMTGYAKDYIGQLCREGRVSARLVGRSWYVLESAIQDHRFGLAEQKAVPEQPPQEYESVSILSKNWQKPRYEAVLSEEMPAIAEKVTEVAEEIAKEATSMQEVWRSWFEHIGESKSEPEEAAAMSTEEEITEENQENNETPIDEEAVKIPIRAIYQPKLEPPPKEEKKAIEANLEVLEEIEEHEPMDLEEEVAKSPFMGVSIRVAGALLAIVFVAVALLGTGYFDRYIISDSRVASIAGVFLYNK